MRRGKGRLRIQLVLHAYSERPQDPPAVCIVFGGGQGGARSTFSDKMVSLNAMLKPYLPSLRYYKKGNSPSLRLRSSLPCYKDTHAGKLPGDVWEALQARQSKYYVGASGVWVSVKSQIRPCFLLDLECFRKVSMYCLMELCLNIAVFSKQVFHLLNMFESFLHSKNKNTIRIRNWCEREKALLCMRFQCQRFMHIYMWWSAVFLRVLWSSNMTSWQRMESRKH